MPRCTGPDEHKWSFGEGTKELSRSLPHRPCLNSTVIQPHFLTFHSHSPIIIASLALQSPHTILISPFTMFSVVLPGRLPLAEPQQVDETHCIFPLTEASSISHVVVFMTGIQPFPPGYSATVHLNWPSASSGAAEWKLLGALRNNKPSAIFKLTSPTGGAGATTTATLGISIEPDALVDQQLATLGSGESVRALTLPAAGAADAQALALQIAPKIANNAMSYLGSFAPDSAPQTLPLLQKWLKQLESKLKSQGIGFLDKNE